MRFKYSYMPQFMGLSSGCADYVMAGELLAPLPNRGTFKSLLERAGCFWDLFEVRSELLLGAPAPPPWALLAPNWKLEAPKTL